jgi:cytochrome c heme-lyase
MARGVGLGGAARQARLLRTTSVAATERACPRGTPPRLVRFVGRPQDFSPKARLLNLLGYKLPFDRHDWVVDRQGTHVRYIIDFYNAAPGSGSAVGMHLDVRPALDSPSALMDRLRMQLRWARMSMTT